MTRDETTRQAGAGVTGALAPTPAELGEPFAIADFAHFNEYIRGDSPAASSTPARTVSFRVRRIAAGRATPAPLSRRTLSALAAIPISQWPARPAGRGSSRPPR